MVVFLYCTKIKMTELLINNDNRLSPLVGDMSHMISPEEARIKLLGLGYDEKYFDALLGGKEVSSHYVHALAVIAFGNGPRDLTDVYHESYPESEKAHLTLNDVEADIASQRAWEEFSPQIKEK